MSDKTGPELATEIAQSPTLDKFFDRNPQTLTDADFRALIELERKNRAAYIEKKSR